MSGPLLELEMLKKCTLLWCEACFQVKMRKAHHGQSTFGSWDVGKVHADVARSTFPSQNGKSTACSFGAWCRKSGLRCAKRASKSKVLKTDGLGRLVGCCCQWQVQWVLHLVKSELNVEVLHFACQSSWSEMLGSSGGRWVAFSTIRSWGFPRWFCVTGAALRVTWLHFFGQSQYFRQMESKKRKAIGTRSPALQSTIHFWRTSRRIASFLMLPTSKIEEVSQNCFVLTLSS